jgi:kynurenine formamidase
MSVLRLLPVWVMVTVPFGCSPESNEQPAEITSPGLVDLTHPFDSNTVYWPTDTRGFRLEELAHGHTEGGWFYSAYSFCTAEHGGTHLDAPVHFHEGGHAVDEVPLEQLVGPGVVIDVSAMTAGNPAYRLTPEDLERHEAQHGPVPRNAIVLLRTDWSDRWPDVLEYLGDDTPGDASRLTFPSYGEAAARTLVEERGVAVLGVDTASIDYGPSPDFPVHRLAAAQQVVGLENLTNLNLLPATGFTVVALPMKITGGSGGPVRVIAMLGRAPRPTQDGS